MMVVQEEENLQLMEKIFHQYQKRKQTQPELRHESV